VGQVAESLIIPLDMKALVLSLDDESHQSILDYTSNVSPSSAASALSLFSFRLHTPANVSHNSTERFTAEYRTIVMLKSRGVYQILQLGYHVLFIDSDIAVLQDPLRLMLWQNVDYVHSTDLGCYRFEQTDSQIISVMALLNSCIDFNQA
jgi:hypothetical protein